MKIVVCLIVFGDYQTFEYRFEKFYNNPNINYIIHYNKRDYLEFKKLEKNELFKQKNIFLFSEVSVFWGDISILDAEIACIQKARENFEDYDNLIILDGKSLPCRSWDYIINKINTFDGNWFNLNNVKYPKNSYWWRWFDNQEVYSNLISNLDRPPGKKGSNWWMSAAKKNFLKNVKRDEKFSKNFKWFFLYIINGWLILLLIWLKHNKSCKKYINYYFDDYTQEFEYDSNRFLSIIGPNMIISRKELDSMMKFDFDKKEYNKLLLKHAPEEYYFIDLYKKSFKEYSSKESKNGFMTIANKRYYSNKKVTRCLEKNLKNYEDLLFVRRYETIKKMKLYKKNIYDKQI